jgi:hypothetical protein
VRQATDFLLVEAPHMMAASTAIPRIACIYVLLRRSISSRIIPARS